MVKRLVIVGGIVALCIFGAWYGQHQARNKVRFVGRASPAGTVTFEDAGTLHIITGLDTVDMYVAVRGDSTITIRSLDLEWR